MVVRAATEADLQPIRTIAQGYGNLVRWPQRPDYIDHELATGRLAVCEAQGIGTPVRGIPPADHDALLLELVDQLHDRGAVDPELLAERLLGDRPLGEQVQDPAESDAQAHRRQPAAGELLAGPSGDDEQGSGTASK